MTAECPLEVPPRPHVCVHGCGFRCFDLWRLHVHQLTRSCRPLLRLDRRRVG